MTDPYDRLTFDNDNFRGELIGHFWLNGVSNLYTFVWVPTFWRKIRAKLNIQSRRKFKKIFPASFTTDKEDEYIPHMCSTMAKLFDGNINMTETRGCHDLYLTK